MTADLYGQMGIEAGDAPGALYNPTARPQRPPHGPKLSDAEQECAEALTAAWRAFPSEERGDIRGDIRHGAQLWGVRPSKRLAKAVFARLLWDGAQTAQALGEAR